MVPVSLVIQAFSSNIVEILSGFRRSLRHRLQKDKSALEYHRAETRAFFAIGLLALVIVFAALQFQMTSIKAFNAILVTIVLSAIAVISVHLVRLTGYRFWRSGIVAISAGLGLGYFS